MLGAGKATPAQFVLRRKTNLRRINAAGQKAGFAAYPSRCSSFSSRKRSAGLRLDEMGLWIGASCSST